MDTRQTCADPLTPPLHPTASWWYTLAHADTPPAALGASASDIQSCAEALAERDHTAPAALLAQVAREARSTEASADGRCVWGFRRLSDALTAARATHRSDYHAYSQPQSLREAALDRLYRRFPLDDFPQATVLLFAGVRLCDDPRLSADPRPGSLLAHATEALAPEEWERYTLCGFQHGVSLVRALSASRWLRVSLGALEDAWAAGQAEAHARPIATTAEPRMEAAARLKAAETIARDLLLRSAPPSAFLRLDDESTLGATLPRTAQAAQAERARAMPTRTATPPAAAARHALRRHSAPGGKSLPYNTRRPAV